MPPGPLMWSGDRSIRSRPRSGADIFPRAQDLPPTGPSPGFAADAPSRHSRNGSAQGIVVPCLDPPPLMKTRATWSLDSRDLCLVDHLRPFGDLGADQDT